MPILNFYMDDSGTRKPDRKPTPFQAGRPNFFALGGVLVKEEDEAEIESAHAELCGKWGITYPLHSVDIRSGMRDFEWLKRGTSTYVRFLADLNRFVTRAPAKLLACVIDRPGYDSRYRPTYGRRSWHLCQTAFYISVERAVKAAITDGRKLRVLPERSNKEDEAKLRTYYAAMKTQGCPFDNPSAKYAPLSPEIFAATLHDLKFKYKTSPITQLADLVLWPVAVERYRPGGRPYSEFKSRGMFVEDGMSSNDAEARGTKYSCFGLVDGKEVG